MRPGKEEEEEEEEAGERKKVKRDSASSSSSDGRKRGMGSGYEPISSQLSVCRSGGRKTLHGPRGPPPPRFCLCQCLGTLFLSIFVMAVRMPEIPKGHSPLTVLLITYNRRASEGVRDPDQPFVVFLHPLPHISIAILAD